MKGVRETFSRYDTADYLKTEADIAAYLEACAEEAPNDAAFMLKALGTVARARNMSQLAEATGMTRAGLYPAKATPASPTP
jgi:probable addiction module antidote protein